MAGEDEKLQSPEQCDGVLKKAGSRYSVNVLEVYLPPPIDRIKER